MARSLHSSGGDSKAGSALPMPAMYLERRYVEDGGLLSYSMSSADLLRRAGGYVDKILKGENPVTSRSSSPPALSWS